jgi:hypothetical protein
LKVLKVCLELQVPQVLRELLVQPARRLLWLDLRVIKAHKACKASKVFKETLALRDLQAPLAQLDLLVAWALWVHKVLKVSKVSKVTLGLLALLARREPLALLDQQALLEHKVSKVLQVLVST